MQRTTTTLLLTAALAAPAFAQPADPVANPPPDQSGELAPPPPDDVVATPDQDMVANLAPAVPEAAPAQPPTPRWSDRITMSGLVDAFISVPFQGDFGDSNALRVFDGKNGSFTLGYAELAVAMAPEPAGFRIDLGFGPVADLTSLETFTDPGPPPVTITGSSEVWKHVQQAYASWKLPGSTAIIVDVGKFVTSTGAEVIEAKDNWLYSRSILFGYAIPFTHTGVRATAALSDKLSVQGMVVNGWDVGVDNNNAKTGGASVLYADSAAGLTGAVNVLVGKEASDVRMLADVVVGKRVSEALSINLNLDFGKEGDASWYGAAAMGKFHVNNSLNLSARAEHFQDPDGVRTAIAGGTAITEVTAGAGIPVGTNGELRLEGRIDLSGDKIYDAGTSSHQATATAAALAWF
jgi:Putative beta-barrel porin-2, OmpL-like. bbp2